MSKAAKIIKEKKVVSNAQEKIIENTKNLKDVIGKKNASEVSTQNNNDIKKCVDDDKIKCCLECRSLYFGARRLMRAQRKLQPRRLIFDI